MAFLFQSSDFTDFKRFLYGESPKSSDFFEQTYIILAHFLKYKMKILKIVERAGFLQGFYAWKEVRWQRRVSVCKPWSLVTTLFKIGQQKLFLKKGRREAISAGGKGNKWFERKISYSDECMDDREETHVAPFLGFQFFQAWGQRRGWPTGIWRSFPGSKRAILLNCSCNKFNLVWRLLKSTNFWRFSLHYQRVERNGGK